MNLVVWLVYIKNQTAFSAFDEENPTYVNSSQKKALLSGVYNSISFKLRSPNSTFWYQFRWPWFSVKVTVVWEIKIWCTHFLANFAVWWNVTQSVGLFKLKLNLLSATNIEGSELYWCGFIKYSFNICPDAYEPIFFKLGMMLKITKLYSTIQVWLTFIFAQDHRVTGKLEFVQSWRAVTDMFWRWLQRRPVNIANIGRLSIYSSCLTTC